MKLTLLFSFLIALAGTSLLFGGNANDTTTPRATLCEAVVFNGQTCVGTYATVTLSENSNEDGGTGVSPCPPLKECEWDINVYMTSISSLVTDACIKDNTCEDDIICAPVDSDPWDKDVDLDVQCNQDCDFSLQLLDINDTVLESFSFNLECEACP